MDPDFSTYDLLPEAVLVIDRGGTIVFANHVAAELLGLPVVELVGCPLDLVVPEERRDRLAERLARLFAEAGPDPVSLGRVIPALHADGCEIPVEVTVRVFHDGGQAVAVLRDRTEMEKVQKELRAAAERFRLAAEVCADIIWEVDLPTDDLQYFGDIDGLLGHAPGEFSRTVTSWREAIHEEDRPGVDAAHQSALETGVYEPPVYRMRRKDGTWVYIEERATVVHTTDGRRERFVGAATNVTERVLAQRKLEDLTRRLEAETEYLRSEIKSQHDFEEIVGKSPVLLATLSAVDRVAATDTSVLILGETGTGKELLARAIHARSARADGPLIKVDCCALPSGLIESELFGHERGSFTGAHTARTGRFELADGATIFLDEIGELPLELQSKLLRVLSEGEFRKLGADTEQAVDVRVIAATNRDLELEVAEGRFRADLYYRLGVFLVESPPLRDRLDDIPVLALYFAQKAAAAQGRPHISIAAESLDRLQSYSWPGNIRELRNIIERAMILSTDDVLVVHDRLATEDARTGGAGRSLKDDLHAVERSRILAALEASGGKIKGPGNAAGRLGMSPSTLRSRMKRLGML